MDAASRRAELERLSAEWGSCTRCPLSEGRTQVVVGSGELDADLMFVGEAPGFHEDRQGMPFVGQAGKLLDHAARRDRPQPRGGLHRQRPQVPAAGQPRPAPDEIEACEGYLFRQVELIRPRVVCTLGNFATKLLSGRPDGITRVHGHPRSGGSASVDVQLYPIYHPAAALYTPAMLYTLREDFAGCPRCCRRPRSHRRRPPSPRRQQRPEPVPVGAGADAEPAQLGLF